MPPTARRSRLAILALVAACGDGVTLPDAAPGDAGPERGRVTVHIDEPSHGDSRVYFQNADSSLVLVTRANDAGDASALMMPGGFVTVIKTGILYTWSGVQPDDELVLDLSFEQSGNETPGSSVRIDPIEGADSYLLTSRCETVDVRTAIEMPFAPFFLPCTRMSDLLLIASSFATGPLGYRFVKDADLRSATIDLRGNYLAFSSQVDVIGTAGLPVSVRQQLANLDYASSNGGTITSTHIVLPTQTPVIDGTTMQSVARTFDTKFPTEGDSAFTTQRAAIVWGPPSTTTTLDLTTPAMRDLTSTPELDLTSYSLRWTETDGIAGDAVWVRIGAFGYEWVVIGARSDETVLRLPVLPGFSSLSPEAFVNNFAIVAIEGGYDRLRPYLLGHWTPTDGTAWPMKEASGRVNYRSLR